MSRVWPEEESAMRRIAVVIAVGLVVAGCGDNEETENEPAASTVEPSATVEPSGRAEESSIPEELIGTWTVTLDPADPDVPEGVWSLIIESDGYRLIASSAPIPNRGDLSVSGDEVVFSNETLCPSAVGQYRWAIQGGTLSFALAGGDACSGNDRTVVLTSKPWTKEA
jgi:hypothetical protein